MANHECYTCLHFDAYFTKFWCSFQRTECGYCSCIKEIKNKHDSCEKWCGKWKRSEFKRKKIIEGLGEALIKLDAISHYLEEE